MNKKTVISCVATFVITLFTTLLISAGKPSAKSHGRLVGIVSEGDRGRGVLVRAWEDGTVERRHDFLLARANDRFWNQWLTIEEEIRVSPDGPGHK